MEVKLFAASEYFPSSVFQYTKINFCKLKNILSAFRSSEKGQNY